MTAEQNYGAHSAHVEMQLLVDGTSIGITHMGWNYIIVESPIDHPPGEASIVLKVDDSESRWKVRLPEGASRSSNRVALALGEITV
jgi:hypothetical protein